MPAMQARIPNPIAANHKFTKFTIRLTRGTFRLTEVLFKLTINNQAMQVRDTYFL